MSEYALYQGDMFITLGTLAEISKETGITEKMLRYYSFASSQKRNPNGRAIIKIEEE
nr:MAG TPA: helix-turn-helix domain protein [Caudoviricetes sp.]